MKSRFALFSSISHWCPFVFLLFVTAATPLTAKAQTTVATIYSDSLVSDWENWSWDTQSNFATSSPVKTGSAAIKVTYSAAWGGLYLHSSGVNLTGATHLQFWIHGGTTGGQTLLLYAEDSTNRAPVQIPLQSYVQGGAVVANAWRLATVPLSALKLGTQPVTGLVWQSGTSGAQSAFYLDDIRLTSDGTTPNPTPTPTPVPQPTPAGPPVGAVPAAVGSKFLLGLSNLPGDFPWLQQSGIPWSARYTYLTGGANTANNWTKWNSPTGQYATYYLSDSATAKCLPVFTYYQILAANPRSYDETLPSYAVKFQDVACMKSYFNDFKLLMSRCRSFNKPVIVHVEPDTWGYMMMTKVSPAQYPVRVATSGHPDAVGLGNNAVGFSQMLVRLRDKYAPKVILALHASPWCAGADVTLNTNASYDIRANAYRTGAWLNALGAGWDLVFVDVADRDAAYKKIVRGQNTWWDETDVALPNFDQVARWIGFLNRKTKRRIIVWQIPIGNTKMRSCNNSWGHYQDNRVQYFLDAAYGQKHLFNWAQMGVIGLLFGRGDGNTTTNTDAAGDGVTNPAAINGNTRTTTFADDDGGYFRERATAYFKAPLAIPGVP